MRGIGYSAKPDTREIKKVVQSIVLTSEGRELVLANAAKNQPKVFLSQFVSVGKLLGVYFPENSDYFLSVGFIEAFSSAVLNHYGDITLPEITYAIEKGMPTYKFHTAPRIPDLISMLAVHYRQRIEWAEEAHNERKKEHLLPYHPKVAEIMKSAIQSLDDTSPI
jgi:hypothetical protein